MKRKMGWELGMASETLSVMLSAQKMLWRSRQIGARLVHVSERLDHRLLVKLVQDRDGPHNIIKGVGKRSNDGHDSQLIIEVGESECGRGK
jgi:hypothetical protein